MIGDIAIMDMDNPMNRSGVFRIAIDTQFAGRGYGTEATNLMLEFGFGILNLHRIQLEVYSINERAIHVYEKVGFKREGVLRDAQYYNNAYYDTIVMIGLCIVSVHKLTGRDLGRDSVAPVMHKYHFGGLGLIEQAGSIAR